MIRHPRTWEGDAERVLALVRGAAHKERSRSSCRATAQHGAWASAAGPAAYLSMYEATAVHSPRTTTRTKTTESLRDGRICGSEQVLGWPRWDDRRSRRARTERRAIRCQRAHAPGARQRNICSTQRSNLRGPRNRRRRPERAANISSHRRGRVPRRCHDGQAVMNGQRGNR